jgi:Xaa-Pro dipeptidase
MLTDSGCRERQRRFREQLTTLGIDAVVLSDYRDIYYLTGALLSDRFPAFLFLETDGGSWLVATAAENVATVDDVLTYEWHKLYTMNPDPVRRLDTVIAGRLRDHTVRRMGWQSEYLPRLLGERIEHTLHPDEWIAVDDALRTMQERKDPDEIELLRRSIQINLAAYTAARAAITPGVNELEVLAAAQRGAMLEAGEPVYHGGDYCCGEFGGPARNRCIEKGELYIIDAQTCYHGYWSDLSRAFAVGDQPTKLQQSIFEHIAAIQQEVPSRLKPGVDGTEIWHWMDQRIREHPTLADEGLTHHAGHAVGLRAHELPDLNRDRGGILQPGNVVSVEPGGYTAEARRGVRIENTYLITETGAENLSEYPIQLTVSTG